jgi:DNA-binding CsgD family transcriptional regulator
MRAGLSPTEELILGYLADGLYDAEIAVRAGLTVEDLKSRIARVLQREHLLDRAALVEWWESGAESTPASALPPNESGRGRSFVLVASIAAFVVVVLVAIALFPGDDSPEPVSPEATIPARLTTVTARFTAITVELGTPTSTARPTATPESVREVYTGNLLIRDGNFNDSTALIFSRENDEGTASIVERVYVDPSDRSNIVTETIWEAPPGVHIIRGTTDWYGDRVALVTGATPSEQGPVQSLMVVGSIGGEFSDPISIRSAYFPHFFAGDSIAIAPTTTASVFGWLLYHPPSGNFEAMWPPERAVAGPIGWTEQTGLIWPSDDGMFIDDKGNDLFQLEHEGSFPVSVEGAVIPPGPDRPVDDTAAAISWTDSGGARFTTHFVVLPNWAKIAQLSGPLTVRGSRFGGGFVGSFCPNFECGPVQVRIGDPVLVTPRDVLWSPANDPELIGSQRGPFARVRADAPPCEPFTLSISRELDNFHCGEPGELLPWGGVINGNALGLHLDAEHAFLRVRLPSGDFAWADMSRLDILID